MDNNKLLETFRNSKYKLKGHGLRNIGVLKEAIKSIDSDMNADVYGSGQVINDFEDQISKLLGKEKAIFFPSGTMAQQIALRIWCDEKELFKIAYHPFSHLEIYEEDGLKKLHNIETILLGEEDRLFNINDLKSMNSDISALLIELPQRSIGGQLPTWKELIDISNYCKEKGIKLHLDGARLWEVVPYYKKSLKEICELFDSVYVSFYKGIGGIAGAILAGDEDFMNKSKVWKRRHGGDLISLYPYIISAKYYLNNRINKMETYYNNAIELAKYFNDIEKIYTIPKVPVSNMFHVYFEECKEKVEKVISEIAEEYNVGIASSLTKVDDDKCKYEISIGDSYNEIPKNILLNAFSKLQREL